MSQTVTPDQNDKGLSMRKITHIIYALFAIGLLSFGFLGVATIAAMVIIYLKRSDAAGTIYAPHFDWLIATFWWGLLWVVLSWVATFIFIGWLTLLVAIIWIIYRVARGWLALYDGQSPRSDYH